MNIIILIFLVLGFIISVYKKVISKKLKNNKIELFKKKQFSKESKIEKIFLRDDEKTFSDPNINIKIGLYENSNSINRKSNIHRARLSKFKRSKLNGQMIYIDKELKIFKYVDGDKIYL